MPMIGLDIGKTRFRAVEVTQEKGSFVLTNYGNHEMTNVALNLFSEESVDLYAREVRDFMSEHAFKTSNVVVAIPEQDVFIRTLRVPKMNQKDLRNYITLGAEEYIPIPLNEVTFDVQLLEEEEVVGSEKEEVDVLLVASRNEVLNRYVAFLKKAGLVPRGMEPETLSMERVLGDTQNRPSASIIVNIGHTNTELIITYKGYVRFTRSIPVGGDALTKAVQNSLSLDYDQAAEYKKAYGLDESQAEGKVFTALKPVFDKVLVELDRAKAYYTSQNPNAIINRVIISGATALMPGLLLYIANNLDVEAELANPWRNVKISKNLESRREELMETGPLYSTAVGLALKEV